MLGADCKALSVPAILRDWVARLDEAERLAIFRDKVAAELSQSSSVSDAVLLTLLRSALRTPATPNLTETEALKVMDRKFDLLHRHRRSHLTPMTQTCGCSLRVRILLTDLLGASVALVLTLISLTVKKPAAAIPTLSRLHAALSEAGTFASRMREIFGMAPDATLDDIIAHAGARVRDGQLAVEE